LLFRISFLFLFPLGNLISQSLVYQEAEEYRGGNMDYPNPHQVQKVLYNADMVSGLIHPVFFCDSLLIVPRAADYYVFCGILYLLYAVVVHLESVVVVLVCQNLMGDAYNHRALASDETLLVKFHPLVVDLDPNHLEIVVSLKVLSPHQVVRMLLPKSLLLLCISFYLPYGSLMAGGTFIGLRPNFALFLL